MSVRKYSLALVLALLGVATAAQAADKPTDPQIAHIAYTAGAIDVAAAKQAIAKSRNKVVVSFAKDMLRDHEAVNKQALALVGKLNVKPARPRQRSPSCAARLSTRPMSPMKSPSTSR